MKFYFGIQSRRLTLWKQYLLSIALTMGTSSTTQVVVWIILLCNTKKVNYIGHQISTPYVVPIPLRLNRFIAKDSPTLDLTDYFIKYNTAIQERKRKEAMFYVKAAPICHFPLWLTWTWLLESQLLLLSNWCGSSDWPITLYFGIHLISKANFVQVIPAVYCYHYAGFVNIKSTYHNHLHLQRQGSPWH